MVLGHLTVTCSHSWLYDWLLDTVVDVEFHPKLHFLTHQPSLGYLTKPLHKKQSQLINNVISIILHFSKIMILSSEKKCKKWNLQHLEALLLWRRYEVCFLFLYRPKLRRYLVGLLPEFVQDRNALPIWSELEDPLSDLILVSHTKRDLKIKINKLFLQWVIVYFNQLSGACRTQKLIEILFCCFETLFLLFASFFFFSDDDRGNMGEQSVFLGIGNRLPKLVDT